MECRPWLGPAPADLFVSSLINSTGIVTRGKYDYYKNQIKYCLKLPIIRLIRSIKSGTKLIRVMLNILEEPDPSVNPRSKLHA